jgi:hypothetical protein
MSPFKKMNANLYVKVSGSGKISKIEEHRGRATYSRAAQAQCTSEQSAGQHFFAESSLAMLR